MIRFYRFLLVLLFLTGSECIRAQDSLSVAGPADSILLDTTAVTVPAIDTAWKSFEAAASGGSFSAFLYKKNAIFPFSGKVVIAGSDIKSFRGKEALFYSLVALLLIFAFLKTVFAKYISDLFRLFFRRTLKQRQISEQLSQTPLPSLVFNSFYMVTAGLYIAFLLQHFNVRSGDSFWMLALYSAAGLGVVYLVKFLVLKFTGWVLNLTTATDAYIFIVFIINKVVGIFLLPFLVLLAFTGGSIYQIAITLSWCGVVCLFVYRFILSYSAVRNQIKVKPFHFLVYLCAFEIVPLLLIYKLLLYFLF